MVSFGMAQAPGIFICRVRLPPTNLFLGIVVGDFNHEGLPDIAAGLLLSNQIAIFINDGKGGYQRSFYASGAGAINLTAFDLNLDGKTDLVVSNFIDIQSPPNALVIFGK